jgi:hypothetical protein
MPQNDNDDHLVEQEARAILSQHGPRAARFAREQAEIAAGLEDGISEAAWRDIAAAIERLQL